MHPQVIFVPAGDLFNNLKTKPIECICIYSKTNRF
jgi:hypothetical protein